MAARGHYHTRITKVDRDIWNYLWQRFEEGRGSPSVHEMARAAYCSPSKVLATLDKLEALNLVVWQWLNEERRAARGCLRVVAPDDEAVRRVRAVDEANHLSIEERRARDRERAKLRMRRIRAKKRGTLISFE